MSRSTTPVVAAGGSPIRIELRAGSADVSFGGRSTTVSGSTVDDVRRAALAVSVQIAREHRQPLLVEATDHEGTWPLVVEPNGTVHDQPEGLSFVRRAGAVLVAAAVVVVLIGGTVVAIDSDGGGSGDAASAASSEDSESSDDAKEQPVSDNGDGKADPKPDDKAEKPGKSGKSKAKSGKKNKGKKKAGKNKNKSGKGKNKAGKNKGKNKGRR